MNLTNEQIEAYRNLKYEDVVKALNEVLYGKQEEDEYDYIPCECECHEGYMMHIKPCCEGGWIKKLKETK